MGGPQSPDEDREAFPYYDPQAEIKLIQKKAIKADRYIVGGSSPWCPAPVCCLWSEV